jgi:hypothetical protein
LKSTPWHGFVHVDGIAMISQLARRATGSINCERGVVCHDNGARPSAPR